MRFLVRKRKQTPTVIIVALIDVLIVLLIFLMVTTTFKQQPAVRIALPESSHATQTGAHENPPLIASIDAKGNLRLGPDAHPVTVDRFEAELLEAVAKKPDLTLLLDGDTHAPWGQVVKVMDAARKANVKLVNAAAKEPGQP